MILHRFDNGWGDDWPIKQFELSILDRYLQALTHSPRSWVVINSTWYSQEYHEQVLTQLRQMRFDGIVLVSMIDARIPEPGWYQEFDCEVIGVGYYGGAHNIDFWSLVLDHWIDIAGYNLDDATTIDTAFMCLNRKPHWHRRRFYHEMLAAGIVEHGIVSLGGDGDQPAVRILPQDQGGCDLAPNGGREQTGIANDIVSLGHPGNWQRHFLNIVTETVYDISRNGFVSEKIYKPIVGLRPFLVYDPQGGVSWLHGRGFETYDLDFANITDLVLSDARNIAPFLKTLSVQGPSYWRSKFQALRPKMLYNQSQFQRYVDQQWQKINQGIQHEF